VRVVLDEAEAARRLLESVESHDQTLDLTAFGEQLIYLLFGCVKRSIVRLASKLEFV
jgi:hypothetical protein